MLIELVHNITLLISLSLIYRSIARRLPFQTLPGKLVRGIVGGAIAIVGMLAPVTVSAGLFFDGRTVVVAAIAMISGPVGATVTAAMVIVTRTILGGPGVLLGIMTTMAAALLGSVAFVVREKGVRLPDQFVFAALGLAVHAVMLLLIFVVPTGNIQAPAGQLIVPVLTVYPLGTYLLCLVLTDIDGRAHAERRLEQRETYIATVLDNLPIGVAVNYVDSGEASYMNRRFAEIYGWPPEELEDISRFFELVYPDPIYRKSLQSQVMADIESGDPDRMHWENIRIRRKDDEERVVDAKNIPLTDQNLMVSTVIDVTDRHGREQAIAESREQLRALTVHLQDLQEAERKWIAAELHDELGQHLTALRMDLDALSQSCGSKPPARERISGMAELINSAVAGLKQITGRLRPGPLDDLGLQPAIQMMTEEMGARSGVSISLDLQIDDEILDDSVATALYRISQEAVVNALRHSSCTHIFISLRETNGRLDLAIKDDGSGFPQAESRTQTFGIAGMRERARSFGGSLVVESSRGNGTEVRACIPT